MSERIKLNQKHGCGNCDLVGDYDGCFEVDCGVNNPWYSQNKGKNRGVILVPINTGVETPAPERETDGLRGQLKGHIERLHRIADDTERSIKGETSPKIKAFYEGRVGCLREGAGNIEKILSDFPAPERKTVLNCFTCPKVLLPPGSVVVPAALLDRVESEYEAFIGWILIEVNMGLSEGRKRTTRQALKAIQGRIKFPDCTQLAEARTALAALKAEYGEVGE